MASPGPGPIRASAIRAASSNVLRPAANGPRKGACSIVGSASREPPKTPLGRAWGLIQDITVTYGYQPWRGLVWLTLLLTTGSVIYAIAPPSALQPQAAPHFNPVIYTLNLLIPVVSFGQRAAFNPSRRRAMAILFLYCLGRKAYQPQREATPQLIEELIISTGDVGEQLLAAEPDLAGSAVATRTLVSDPGPEPSRHPPRGGRLRPRARQVSTPWPTSRMWIGPR